MFLLFLYFAFAPFTENTFYQKLLFGPVKVPAGGYQVDRYSLPEPEDVTFISKDAHDLHGWFFKNPDSNCVILFSHGNCGNITSRLLEVDALFRAGASVFVYDYSGYGKSRGEPALDVAMRDAESAYDYLVDGRQISSDKLILYGESLGSGITCQLSTKRKCAGIILHAPFTSLRGLGRQIFPFLHLYPDWLFPGTVLSNVEVLSKPHPPLLIIHGDMDDTVPIWEGRRLYEQATKPKKIVIIPGGRHAGCPEVAPDLFNDSIRNFIALCMSTSE